MKIFLKQIKKKQHNNKTRVREVTQRAVQVGQPKFLSWNSHKKPIVVSCSASVTVCRAKVEEETRKSPRRLEAR